MDSGSINLGSPVNWASPLNVGLVSWWLPLPNNQGGFTLFDLCSRNHGTLTNMDPASDWVSGQWGTTALDYDGSDDHVVLATSGLASASRWTVGFWIYSRDATTALKSPFGSSLATTHALPTVRNHSSTNKYQIFAGNGAAFFINGVSTSGDAVADTWEHIAIVYNAADCLVYRNGLLTDTLVATDGASLSATPSDFRLGGGGSVSALNWNGMLTDVFIGNTAFSADQLWQRYTDSLTGYQRTLQRKIRLAYFNQISAAAATNHHFLTLLGAA